MRFGIIGTGVVGKTFAAKLAELNHEVMIGTRDVAATLARTEPDTFGHPPFSVWKEQHPQVQLGTFTQAAAHGELLLNATPGGASLEVLQTIGIKHLHDKVLIDIANALDFSHGVPPSLSVVNTDSLGEQIQRAFPRVKVVKTLNTMTAPLMVNPSLVADGDHHVFVCGNDAQAKAQVTQLLTTFGWKHIIDLGDISAARGTEMVLPIWIRLMGALQTPMFNFKIAQ
jgi:8-hydroxy-5-deazaflavin:NADPH oxidoreductase